MFFTQILRASASFTRNQAARSAGGRQSHPWALSETKRLASDVLGWVGTMSVVLLWPKAVEMSSSHHGVSPIGH